MANPKLTVDVAGNTRPLERDINKIQSKKVSLNLDSKNFSQPLGKIRGELGEFDKSLQASNARVLAFGASAGAIYALQRALAETVKSTIEVEKSLTEVNVILGTSQKKLAGFGNELFNIAKRTGRSFQDVAVAGGELARQGLAMEETLKRTSDAMVLARLSGLGVEESVNAITAALNGFRNAALDSTAVVDKLIAVDQAFAVSGADLAEALRRVGSTAEGAGVSLDELLGIVTAAQQITARGGAVIGNSFKTIFTRIQRPKVLEALDQLGVKTKNASGASLSATQVLKNLANTFDRLSESQQAQIAELVGGVFQINVLKASLRDLGSQYSVFTSATEIAGRASGESARRNAELNKTLAAGLNETLQNITKLGAAVGKLTLEPAIRNVLGIVNAITEKLSLGDAESQGQSIAKAFLGGLGKFLAGPGLAIAASVLIQLFNNLRKFAVDAFNTFSGLNASFKQQQQLQSGIVNILKQNPKILAQIQRGEISVDAAAQQILGSYQHLNMELTEMNALANQLATSMSRAGASIQTVAGAQTIARGKPKATGYVPNFADEGEVAAMALSGMYSKTQIANPRTRRGRVYDGQGRSFMATYNGHEKKQDVIGPNGRKGTIIASPAMQAAARGFIPNFVRRPAAEIAADPEVRKIYAAEAVAKGYPPLSKAKQNDINRFYRQEKIQGRLKEESKVIPTASLDGQAGIFTTGRGMSKEGIAEFSEAEAVKLLGATSDAAGKVSGLIVRGMVQGQTRAMKDKLGKDTTFDQIVESELRTPLKNITKAMLGGSKDAKDLPSPVDVWKKAAEDTSGYPQFLGRIFEAGINSVIGKTPAKSGTWDYLKGDFDAPRGQATIYKSLFGSDLASLKKANYIDAKRSGFEERATRDSIAGKISRTPALQTNILGDVNSFLANKAAGGYVPNFYKPLGDAIKRENNAGVSKSAIRVGSDRRLASGSNPFGLAVTNTRDEPRGIKDVLARGYVPNFVILGKKKRDEIREREGRAKLPQRMPRPDSLGDDKNKKGKEIGTSTEKAAIGMEKLFAVSMIASMATSTFAAAAEDGTESQKALATNVMAATNGLTTAISVIAAFPGPTGIAIGAIAGLGMAAMSWSQSMTETQSAMKEYNEALTEAGVALQEQGNAIQQAQQALSGLTAALDSGDASQVQSAQKKYAEALSKLPAELRTKVLAESDPTKRQAILGKAAGETAQKSASNEEAKKTNELLQKQLEDQAKAERQSTVIKTLVGLAVAVGIIIALMKANKLASAGKRITALGGKAGRVGLGGAKIGGFGKAAAVAASKLKVLGATFLKALAPAALVVQAFGSLGTAISKVTSETSTLGKMARFLSRNFDILGGVLGYFKARKGEKQARRALSSERYIEPGKEELGITDEGKEKMKGDAQAIVSALGRDLTADELEKIRMAGGKDLREAKEGETPGTENLQKTLEELGLSAEQAGSFVKGAGAGVYGLALEISNTSIAAQKAAAETARLQAAMDRQAAAAAAAQRATEQAAKRSYEFAKAMNVAAKNVQAARNRQQQYNRELTMAALKGGAQLASNFQTSFQKTKMDGDIAKLEINEKAGVEAEKLRRKGSEDMFKAVLKQEGIAKVFEELGKTGGGTNAGVLQSFAQDMQNALLATSGQGGASTLAQLQQVITAAQGKGGALEGQKIDIRNFEGIQTLLTQQLGEMQKAEQTRLEQLAMQNLQTRLAQAQNKINMDMAAGGGIKAFLDPKSMDAMEDNFSNALSGFTTASNRGDSVKTGQFAGQLLGSLNEFMGGPMMGEGADGLKDLVQGGLEQSLRGRAMARADMLDQAAQETGNQDLAKAAAALRSRDFGKIAETQVAAEFKRSQMPANIENLLKLEEQMAQVQRQDAQANAATARNTANMMQFLTGGKFVGAMGDLVRNLPLGDAMEPTNQNIIKVREGLKAIPAAISTAFADIGKSEKIAKIQEDRKTKTLELKDFIDKAKEDGRIDAEEAAEIERRSTEIGKADIEANRLFTSMSDAGRAGFDPREAAMIQNRAAIMQASIRTQDTGNIDADRINAREMAMLGPIFSEIVGGLKEMRNSLDIGRAAGDGFQNEDATRSMYRGKTLRTQVRRTLRNDGKDAALAEAASNIKNMQEAVLMGNMDKEQAALQIGMMKMLMERIESGQTTGQTTDVGGNEFIEMFLNRLENAQMRSGQPVVNITIDPKVALSGRPEIVKLEASIQQIRGALGAEQSGAQANIN